MALWESCAHRVHAYATRHVGANAAEEVVAETFLVAWRRLTDVPGDPLPWLIVVARNTIANARRSTYRARTLEAELTRLAEAAAPSAAGPEPAVVDRDVMLRGLARLTAVEREALLLIAWDGLTAAQAAAAAGCSTTAFYVRLHRARRRLAGLVDDPPAEGTRRQSSLVPGTQTTCCTTTVPEVRMRLTTLDRELARLAPTPGPDALEAARTRVMAEITDAADAACRNVHPYRHGGPNPRRRRRPPAASQDHSIPPGRRAPRDRGVARRCERRRRHPVARSVRLLGARRLRRVARGP